MPLRAGLCATWGSASGTGEELRDGKLVPLGDTVGLFEAVDRHPRDLKRFRELLLRHPEAEPEVPELLPFQTKSSLLAFVGCGQTGAARHPKR